MKKMYSHIQVACLCLFSGILMNGCVKDSGMKKTRIYTPIVKTSAEVRAAIKSDPSLEITNPGKIFVLGNYIFMNEVGRGVHIIDNTNPAAPVNKAFINIPGNEDIAVKGSTLYADCFTDLMVIDISNPAAVSLKTYVSNIFPDRQTVLGYQLATNTVITEWVSRDTVMTLDVAEGQGLWENGNYYNYYPYPSGIYYAASSLYNGSVPQSASDKSGGVGGSMSRFALINDYLYAVTTSKLNVVNISNSMAPAWSKTVELNNFMIETIYPFKNKLFIGSQTGMSIYSVSNPEAPLPQGQFQHVRNCDPVIANDDYAFVTLHAGTMCGGSLNELDVLDIKDLTNPALIKSYTLTSPHGLSQDGNLLFICDGTDGLKVFDAKDVLNIRQISKVEMAETFDVICYNKIAIVSAKDGLYQYDYSNASAIKLLSKIVLKQQ